MSLLIRVGGALCAAPVEHVIETLRPLPVVAVSTAPAEVLGMTVHRGASVPVVCVATLLGLRADGPPKRFVAVRTSARVVVLAVDDVVGCTAIRPSDLRALPPLLGDDHAGIVAAMGARDGALLLVLATLRLLDGWTP